MPSVRPRVLLVQPVRHSSVASKSPPLGLCYLAATAEQKGCQTRILDASSPYGGYSYKDILEEARNFQPDLVGITLLTYFVAQTYGLMQSLTSLGAMMVAGGSHATLLPEEVLAKGAAVVVRGEGEATFADIIDHVRGEKSLEDIAGVSFIREGQIVHNASRPLKNLDEIPFPAKHLVRREDYARSDSERSRLGNLVASRGCIGRCTYCSARGVWGPRYRCRSPENILEEMLALKERYGVTSFSFYDDVMTVNKRVVAGFCDLLLKEFPEARWETQTRPDCVDRELLLKMKEAGCTFISYGVESANPGTLQRVKKGFTLEQVEDTVEETLKARIHLCLNFMWGFPWETPQDIRASREAVERFIRRYPTVGIQAGGVLVPFPGTEVYEEFKVEYGFENWWLRDGEFNWRFRGNSAVPFYQRVYFGDDGQMVDNKSSFFAYRPEVRRALKQAEAFVGRHTLANSLRQMVTGRVRRQLALVAGLFLVKVSRWLYRFSPTLEKGTFRAVSKLAHRLR